MHLAKTNVETRRESMSQTPGLGVLPADALSYPVGAVLRCGLLMLGG